MDLLVNIDVPDLAAAIAFYADAFGLTVTRRLVPDAAELAGWPVRLFLLQQPAGSIGAAAERRRYERHWTPVHLDVVVDDLDPAFARAIAAGARAETDIRTEAWGRMVILADPFGHGFCLIHFSAAAMTRLRHQDSANESRPRCEPASAGLTMHSVVLPAIIGAGSDQAARRFLESFAATLRNKNTRLSYYRVACQVEQQRIRRHRAYACQLL